MNETKEEVTQEQRKAALSTININYRITSNTDRFDSVAAYQLLDGVLIIAVQDGPQYLIPMDITSGVIITQNKE